MVYFCVKERWVFRHYVAIGDSNTFESILKNRIEINICILNVINDLKKDYNYFGEIDINDLKGKIFYEVSKKTKNEFNIEYLNKDIEEILNNL